MREKGGRLPVFTTLLLLLLGGFSDSGAVIPQVSLASLNAVVLNSDGTVWGWGDRSNGQLGVGASTAGSFRPVAVTGLTGVTAVSAGNGSTIALKFDGTVVALGSNSKWLFGDRAPTDLRIPMTVPGLNGVIAVSARGAGAALKSDGTVVSWGDNSHGQLGDGTTTIRYGPTTVPGLAGVVAVSAGDVFIIALKSDGTVVSWGDNSHGQLGDGTTTDRHSPVPVLGLSGVGAVSAGYLFTVALKSNGTVAAWGRNFYGELGDGTTTNRLTPVPVPGLTNVVAASAGNEFAVALQADGTLLAWGSNITGELGNGRTTGYNSNTVPIAIQGLNLGASATCDCIFNWVERTYPQYFFPARASSVSQPPYFYRYYLATGNYFASSSANGDLWALGPSTGHDLLDVGRAQDFQMMSGCVGQPVGPTLSFPIASVMTAFQREGHDYALSATLIGRTSSATMTLDIVSAPGSRTTFEGQPAATMVTSEIISINGIVTKSAGNTEYFTADSYKALGNVSNGSYEVISGQLPFPSNAIIGQSDTLHTSTTYTDSSKKTVLYTSIYTWTLEPDTPTTTWLCINERDIDVYGYSQMIGSYCYKIDQYANVSALKLLMPNPIDSSQILTFQ